MGIISLFMGGAALIVTGVAFYDNAILRPCHAAVVMVIGMLLVIAATAFTPSGELKRPLILDHQVQQRPADIDWDRVAEIGRRESGR
jgi:peptidoglycan/LPS O-acetylase OafA/YrhL